MKRIKLSPKEEETKISLELPNDVIHHACEYMSIVDIWNLSITNKTCRQQTKGVLFRIFKNRLDIAIRLRAPHLTSDIITGEECTISGSIVLSTLLDKVWYSNNFLRSLGSTRLSDIDVYTNRTDYRIIAKQFGLDAFYGPHSNSMTYTDTGVVSLYNRKEEQVMDVIMTSNILEELSRFDLEICKCSYDGKELIIPTPSHTLNRISKIYTVKTSYRIEKYIKRGIIFSNPETLFEPWNLFEHFYRFIGIGGINDILDDYNQHRTAKRLMLKHGIGAYGTTWILRPSPKLDANTFKSWCRTEEPIGVFKFEWNALKNLMEMIPLIGESVEDVKKRYNRVSEDPPHPKPCMGQCYYTIDEQTEIFNIMIDKITPESFLRFTAKVEAVKAELNL